METSEGILNIVKAYCKFQGLVKNPKNTATNPHVNSRYSPLDEVLNEVRPVLAQCGLSVLQEPSGDKDSMAVATYLIHESGEWLKLAPIVFAPDNERDTRKSAIQGAGSAITYARRYALCALLGIAGEADTDGAPATKPQKNPTQKPQQPQQPKNAPARGNAPADKKQGNTAPPAAPKAQPEAPPPASATEQEQKTGPALLNRILDLQAERSARPNINAEVQALVTKAGGKDIETLTPRQATEVIAALNQLPPF